MIDRLDRFLGALLGVACGDALGAPLEGAPPAGPQHDFLPTRRGLGRYTDDTEMTLALAESLVRCNGIDGRDAARGYLERFDPDRGYGAGTRWALDQLRQGEDYRRTGTALFPDGSPGSGAAMRIAPVGLIYGTGPAPCLREAVFEAVRCTHVHPLALDGAVVQARVIGLLSTRETGSEIQFSEVAADLRRRVETDAFTGKIDVLADLLNRRAEEREAVERLGNGFGALEAVPAAIWFAFRHDFLAEESMSRAVGAGGDTDTIGAMTGALVGARRGASSLPPHWVSNLEPGPGGRDRIVSLARQLGGLRVDEYRESRAYREVSGSPVGREPPGR